MKKSIALLLSLVLCLGLLLSLSACSKESYDGTYYLYFNEKLQKDQFFILADGKWSNHQELSGTYTVEDGKITLYMTGPTHTAILHEGTVGGGQLELDLAGYKMTYRMEAVAE